MRRDLSKDPSPASQEPLPPATRGLGAGLGAGLGTGP